MEASIQEVHEIEEEIEENYVKETRQRLQQNWDRLKPTLAVCSGGLHQGHVPFLIKNFCDCLSKIMFIFYSEIKILSFEIIFIPLG
jgi:ribulose 1,5-bisphosphate carboxylase large subunit-like protein